MKRWFVAGAMGVMAMIAIEGSAAAANDRGCKSSKPPVIVVHGQAGDFNQMTDVVRTLEGDGFCVYGKNYGVEHPGGLNGRAHVDVSAQEIGEFIDGVMRDTGAAKVNVIGHSAGTGVLNNWIQLRGGAAKTNRLVSFAGMHHPYGHVGLANIIDATLFLPNTVAAAQNFLPPFTSNLQLSDIAKAAVPIAGNAVSAQDADLATCGFTSDLFSPQYWTKLQGSLSEAPGQFVAIGQSVRSLKTKDSVPNVCYTNIVGILDPVVGASAGFQHEGSNIENFVLMSGADHSTILNDPTALRKMLSGLDAPCTPAKPDEDAQQGLAADGTYHFGGEAFAEKDAKTKSSITPEEVEDELEARGERRTYDLESSGCSASPASSGSPAAGAGVMTLLLGLVLRVTRRPRRR